MDWIKARSERWKGPWGLKKIAEAVAIGVGLVAAFSIFVAMVQQRKYTLGSMSGCHFPAIYNFGDSNSDTGSTSAAFGRVPPPNGETFFGKPVGRYSDGRLIIDFIAEKLGLPFLSAYLDSIGRPTFQHGANFAASGSTIQRVDAKLLEGGFNPISLDIQLLQFEQLKARTTELYDQAKSSEMKGSLPRPTDFSNALYTLDSGQNDLHAALQSMTEEQVQASIPNIINHFVLAIKQLYQQGARIFWIHNTGPIGCLPYFVIDYPPKPGNADQNGCLKSYNKVAQEFNKQLKDRVAQLRTKLQDAVLTYVDIYSAKYSLISAAKEHGFVEPLGCCCGHYGDHAVRCWEKTNMNGTEVYAASCSNPLEYISWDGIHYTEAANQWVANHILDGLLSDPPIPITQACRKPVHLP
ncbi:hypothetical protein L1049_006469 [Liquidambar formosana]|uniref:Uncharacterized protein n=1 Tax=Liquidambar formosana TaxID=63359 RepID=A0AAP0RIG8_LIQFO